LTASGEIIDVNINLARTVQRAAGAVTTQRAMYIQAPTYSFAGSSTITTASTLAISGAPSAGTNATLTKSYALNVEAGNVNIGGSIGYAATAPTARLHLPAGTTSASSAPLKLTSGTAMTTPEDGAIEYHGSHLYFTIGSTRYQLDQQSSGSGTVSSVALTMPSDFSVGGSPVTTSGTLAVTYANQNANIVFSGPSSGGAAAPAFRALVMADLPTAVKVERFGMTIGGGGVITTGSKGYMLIPCAGTITKVTLLADQSGTIAIDLKKSTYSGFPTTSSITASAKPTLSSAQKYQDSTLTGWTTSVSAGDVIEFVVDSGTTPASVTQVTVIVEMTRT
jgi:hypothetical protein